MIHCTHEKIGESEFERACRIMATTKLSIFLALLAITLIFTSSGVWAQSYQLKPIFSITGDDAFGKLNMPGDVFVDDEHGEIYVVDSGNRRVVVFEMDGLYRHQFAVPAGKGEPTGLVVNNRGEILIAVGGKIAVCDFRGSLLEYVDFRDFPSANKVNARRVKVDKAGNCYVLDAAGPRVLIFDANWEFRFAIGKESFAKTTRNLVHSKNQEKPITEILGISDICVDNEGMIYLVDPMASHLHAFGNTGEYAHSIGQPGAAFTSLSLPIGACIDNQDRVLVVDTTGHGLLGYDGDGRLLFALGGLGVSPGRLYFPKYVSADGNGRIYVVESFLNRIQVLALEYSAATARITQID